MDADKLAAEMYAECARSEQSARVVLSEEQALAVRQNIRARARADHLRIRTARMDDLVVAVRLDAELWNQTTATMRHKLRPQ